MPVYTVHASMDHRISSRGGDAVIFVRDGFKLSAVIFGPFWLAAHRLWLALLGWLVVVVALNAGVGLTTGSGVAVLLADLLLALLLGVEAASLERWTLSRRHWRQLDLVVAADQEQAERRFFDRWTRRGSDDSWQSVDRGGPPPTRTMQGQPFSQPSREPIIGLFPEPGASQ